MNRTWSFTSKVWGWTVEWTCYWPSHISVPRVSSEWLHSVTEMGSCTLRQNMNPFLSWLDPEKRQIFWVHKYLPFCKKKIWAGPGQVSCWRHPIWWCFHGLIAIPRLVKVPMPLTRDKRHELWSWGVHQLSYTYDMCIIMFAILWPFKPHVMFRQTKKCHQVRGHFACQLRSQLLSEVSTAKFHWIW